MIKSAKIPDKIVLNVNTETNNKYFVGKNDYIDLSRKEISQHKKYSQKNKIVVSYPFLLLTKKESKKYENDCRFVIHENKPIKLKLIGVQYSINERYSTRANVAKPIVQMPSGHLIDIQQDIFANALLSDGIGKDGVLPGEYLFACINKQLELIQVDSELHKATLRHVKNRSDSRPLKIQDLTVGKIYKTAAGNAGLLLGFVTTETMLVDLPKHESYYYIQKINHKEVDYSVRFLQKDFGTLWYKIKLEKLGGEKTSDEIIAELKCAIATKNLFDICALKNYSFVEEVPGYYLDLPYNIVLQIRAVAIEKAEKTLQIGRLSRTNPDAKYKDLCNQSSFLNPPDDIDFRDALRISYYCPLANMTLFGTGLIRSKPFKIFEHRIVANNKNTKKKK